MGHDGFLRFDYIKGMSAIGWWQTCDIDEKTEIVLVFRRANNSQIEGLGSL